MSIISKHTTNTPPLITVVTVCYNAASNIEATLRSVIAQMTSDVEYLVIDGGSTDGTIAIIDRYRSAFAHFVSEPDNGIYDAMNKGLQLATGRYVTFLNAGDLYTPLALSTVLAVVRNDYPAVVYSDFYLYRSDRQWLIPGCSLDPQRLKRDYTACHQSLFVARKLAPPYDLTYLIKADYKWTLDVVQQAVPERVIKVQYPLVRYMCDGFSDKQVVMNIKELIRLHFEYFGVVQVLLNCPVYAYRMLRVIKQKLVD